MTGRHRESIDPTRKKENMELRRSNLDIQISNFWRFFGVSYFSILWLNILSWRDGKSDKAEIGRRTCLIQSKMFTNSPWVSICLPRWLENRFHDSTFTCACDLRVVYCRHNANFPTHFIHMGRGQAIKIIWHLFKFTELIRSINYKRWRRRWKNMWYILENQWTIKCQTQTWNEASVFICTFGNWRWKISFWIRCE